MNDELRKVIKRLHYPLEVMLVCVRWYAAYPLSLRHLEEMIEPPRFLRRLQLLKRWSHEQVKQVLT